MLEEYTFNQLSVSQVEALELHLLVCEPCQNALEETQQYIRSMKAGLTRTALRPTAVPMRKRFLWGMAAALALGAALLVTTPHLDNTEPVPVNLVSLRGGPGAATSRAPARRPLEVAFEIPDARIAPGYHVEVVTTKGERAWSGVAKPREGKLYAVLPGTMARGNYWVRLFGPDSNQLYEYGLQLE